MTIPFEFTRSYGYKAARYEIMPRLLEMVRNSNDEAFKISELANVILDEIYTKEQLEKRIPKNNSENTDSMRSLFLFYIRYSARREPSLKNFGEGWFQLISVEDAILDAEEEGDAQEFEPENPGIIYAYSFPSIKRDGAFPIKVGMTAGTPEKRIEQQCRATCCFEYPEVLQSWKVDRVGVVETVIHKILEARGRARQAPGREWFDTTVEEIESIINFVRAK